MLVSTSLNPAPWFQKMREESPVYYDPDIIYYFGKKGGWQVFRYEDVKNGISNHELFSNEFIPRQKGGLGESVAMTDPPRHTELRSLITKAFPTAVARRMEEWIRHKSEKLLEPWFQSGQMEFIENFADALATGTIAQLLGIPESYHKRFTDWTKTLIGDPVVIGVEAYQQAQQEMGLFLVQMMKDREQSPQEDLMTYLLQSEKEGGKLSPDDVISSSIALLAAGSETEAGLLGNVMLTLAERPEVQQHLAQHPEDIPKAINEVLRFRCPVLSIPRIARQDVVINGQLIPKGEMVNFWLASANLDPAVFPQPDIFDMHRDNSKILSFGHGMHACIGYFLAKLEAKIAFETIFKHVRDISIAPENVLSRFSNVSTFKFNSLLINFRHIGAFVDSH